MRAELEFSSKPRTVASRVSIPWPTVFVAGEIDMSNVAALVARLLAAAPGGLGVAVDFTFVDFIDVVGVNALVEACNRLRSTGSDLVVRAPSDRLRWMLALFELGELIETTRSESNAHLPC